jgi:hypothetical protein
MDGFTALWGVGRGVGTHPESADVFLRDLVYSRPLVLADGKLLARYVKEGESLGREPLIAAAPAVELYEFTTPDDGSAGSAGSAGTLITSESADLVLRNPLIISADRLSSEDTRLFVAWLRLNFNAEARA